MGWAGYSYPLSPPRPGDHGDASAGVARSVCGGGRLGTASITAGGGAFQLAAGRDLATAAC